jgi:hypothetical protein
MQSTGAQRLDFARRGCPRGGGAAMSVLRSSFSGCGFQNASGIFPSYETARESEGFFRKFPITRNSLFRSWVLARRTQETPCAAGAFLPSHNAGTSLDDVTFPVFFAVSRERARTGEDRSPAATVTIGATRGPARRPPPLTQAPRRRPTLSGASGCTTRARERCQHTQASADRRGRRNPEKAAAPPIESRRHHPPCVL